MAGIQLCPLETAVIVDYLVDSAAGPIATQRWGPIIGQLTTDGSRPMAEALRTPLMAALARANYNPRPGEGVSAVAGRPAELLEFQDSDSVRKHLFDCFVPAAYRPRPDGPRRREWNAAEAQRWLRFLATDLHYRQRGATDISWWQLHGAVPRCPVSPFRWTADSM